MFPELDHGQRLLVNVLCNPGVDPAECWSEWTGRTDWLNRPVDALSGELLPAVYLRLLSLDRDLPDLRRLKGIYRRAWSTQERLDRPFAEAMAFLAGSDCPVLLLGAAANAVVARQSGNRRFYSQLVCLVPEDRHEAMIQGLQAQAWSVAKQIPGFAVRLKHPDGAVLQLNRHAAPEQRRTGADEGLWANGLTAELGGIPVRLPSLEDLLLLTIQHGRRPESFRTAYWMVDSCALLQARLPDLDWAYLEAAAGARGVSLRVGNALAALNQAFNVAVPGEMTDRLRANAAWFELREEAILSGGRRAARWQQAYGDYLRLAGRPSGPGWWWRCLRFVLTEYNPPEGQRVLPWLAVRLFRRIRRI